MTDSSLFKEIGRSFLVSSLLPASLFVTLGIFLFRGFVPLSWQWGFKDNQDLLGPDFWIALVFISWVAFYLFSSVHWTVQLFEGYKVPRVVRQWIVKHWRKRWYLKIAPNYYRLRILKSKGLDDPKRAAEFDRLYPLAYNELCEIGLQFPTNPRHLLLTRLGNVLRAGELYSLERYAMDGLTFWPRLFHVLPAQFLQDMEEKNNQMLFLLNSALLLYVNAFLSTLAGFYGLFLNSRTPLALVSNAYLNAFRNFYPHDYLLIAVFLAVFAYMLYRIGVNAAEDYALFVRAGFDLYRFDLLKQLGQEAPTELSSERNLWEKLTDFFNVGNELGLSDKPIVLKYKSPSPEAAPPPPVYTVNVQLERPARYRKKKRGASR